MPDSFGLIPHNSSGLCNVYYGMDMIAPAVEKMNDTFDTHSLAHCCQICTENSDTCKAFTYK